MHTLTTCPNNCPIPAGGARPPASPEARQIAALNAICAMYEDGGYGDPGRAIDAVRDVLGRRDGA